MNPLVSVVCLCYNHELFVAEAIHSVLNQTYPNIQLIVVDDCSTDGSVQVIREIVDNKPSIDFIHLKQNLGNCKAFNQAFEKVKGEYVIDFAADDVMLPNRIEKQVNHFQKLSNSFGVVFSNADYIDAYGNFLRNHSEHLLKKKRIKVVPQGWIFQPVLFRYFICSPTMMIRKKVLDDLNGYDENLAYEDFDFWVRASRTYQFAYLPEVLTQVRRNIKSMSTQWYAQGDRQLHSTYLVCQKAVGLCQTDEEKNALLMRVRYEFKQAVFSNNKMEAKLFAELEKKLAKHGLRFYLLSFLSRLPLPWAWVRNTYYQLRYG